MTTYLITGGTGLVGSHAADRAVSLGGHVRALVRPGSDTAHLEQIGAELVPGDMEDEPALQKAAAGVDVVIHCAAKVGDWGPVEDYRRVNVDGLRHLLEAVRGTGLKRFVHLSSLGVYEARHHYGTDETEPLPDTHLDGYRVTKVESEKLALAEFRKHGTPVTVIRPGFIYGPRDRTVLPRMAERLSKGSVVLIDRGRHALNCTYVENLVEAIFLAVDNPNAVGEAFNVTDGEVVSKRRFLDTFADGLGLKRPKWSMPLWLARPLARWRENVFLRKGKPHPPLITQAGVRFAGLNLDFSIAKARTVLGYDPHVSFDEGMRRTLAWYQSAQPAPETKS